MRVVVLLPWCYCGGSTTVLHLLLSRYLLAVTTSVVTCKYLPSPYSLPLSLFLLLPLAQGPAL